MDIYSLAAICFRRWYVFFPVLLLGVVVSVSAARSAEPLYTLQQAIIVLPSGSNSAETGATRGEVQGGNPFAIAAGGERTAAAALAQRLGSNDVKATVRDRGPGDYSVLNLRNEQVITVTAAANSVAAATAVIEGVTDAAGPVFEELQVNAGAAPGSLLQIVPISDVVLVEVGFPGRSRLVVAAAAAALLLATLASVALEGIRRRGAVTRRRPALVAKPSV